MEQKKSIQYNSSSNNHLLYLPQYATNQITLNNIIPKMFTDIVILYI